jgi:hypothetical protein
LWRIASNDKWGCEEAKVEDPQWIVN